MKTAKEKIKEMEEDFEEHSTKIGNISDYTEWRILKSKLKGYKEAISDIRALIEKLQYQEEELEGIGDRRIGYNQAVKEILSEIEGGKQE